MYDVWLESLENGEVAALCFLSMSAAFDIVDLIQECRIGYQVILRKNTSVSVLMDASQSFSGFSMESLMDLF